MTPIKKVFGRPNEDSVRLSITLRRKTRQGAARLAKRRSLPLSRVIDELLQDALKLRRNQK